jgi:CHAD domain-containing protein
MANPVEGHSLFVLSTTSFYMQSNESINNHLHLNIPQNQSRLVFERMNRSIGRLSKSITPENVHHFRTNGRRVAALIERLSPQTRNKKKVLKLVAKLRKRAGKLRDIDVQIAFLNNLKVPDRQNHRAQMLELLAEEHARRSRKLSKSADSAALQELRKRLRREQKAIKLDGVDPLRLALSSLPKPSQVPLTEKTLHSFRIGVKQARYMAELAGESPEAKVFADELRRAQDAAGEWHDAVKLKEKAEKRFGSASESALVSVLQNISRARFRSANNTLMTALTTLSQERQPAKRSAHVQHHVSASTAARSTAVA